MSSWFAAADSKKTVAADSIAADSGDDAGQARSVLADNGAGAGARLDQMRLY